MYIEKAIERLNNINWNNIGRNGQKKDMELGIEFLRKMAVFCKKNDIKPNLPFMTNLSLAQDHCVISKEILNKCNENVRMIIENPSLSTSIVNYYLQVSISADQNPEYIDCIDVYEPIIRLFEKGGDFVYRERGMSFINSGLIPLTNWLENFSN